MIIEKSALKGMKLTNLSFSRTYDILDTEKLVTFPTEMPKATGMSKTLMVRMRNGNPVSRKFRSKLAIFGFAEIPVNSELK